MCHIYIYTNTHAKHTHICITPTHTLVQTSQFTLLLCMRAPERERLFSEPLAPASVHANTLKRKHTKSRALIFLAIVQPFHSSKPYHKSLHSCSLSISIRQACIVFISRPAEDEEDEPYFSPHFWVRFLSQTARIVLCYRTSRRVLSWCKHRARLARSQTSLGLLRKKHTAAAVRGGGKKAGKSDASSRSFSPSFLRV